MREWLITFLKLLEKEIPPDRGAHHAITCGQYGSDQSGWEDKLCIHLRTDRKSSTYFLDETDFSKPLDTLVNEMKELHSKKYYPNDPRSEEALCLRTDHTHTVEDGCWIPRPTAERIRERGAANR